MEGRIQTRSWDDKQSGEKKYRTEVVCDNFQMLGQRGGGPDMEADAPHSGGGPTYDEGLGGPGAPRGRRYSVLARAGRRQGHIGSTRGQSGLRQGRPAGAVTWRQGPELLPAADGLAAGTTVPVRGGGRGETRSGAGAF